jgi:hypothetical protein
MNKIPVTIMLIPETTVGTVFYASEKIMDLPDDISDVAMRQKLLGKLQFFCDSNFRMFMPDTIKREYGKTYGIHLDRFRIVGFFDESYEIFIALDWFVKKTQKNDRRMNAIYEKVDKIRENELWTKVE